MRILVFPLVVKAQKSTAVMTEHMPKIQYLTQRMTDARRHGDDYEGEKNENSKQQNNTNLKEIMTNFFNFVFV